MRSTSSTPPRWPRPVPDRGSTLAERDGDAAVIPTPLPADRPPAWPHRHLLDTDVLTWPQIELVLDTADVMAQIVARRRPRSEALRGIGVTNLFYEASTRTRVSFEVAVSTLGGHCVTLRGEELGLGSRESVADVARTLASYCTMVGARGRMRSAVWA